MIAVRLAATVSAVILPVVTACGPAWQPPASTIRVSDPREVLQEWTGHVTTAAWAGDATLAVVVGNGDVVRANLAGGTHQRLDQLRLLASDVAADPESGVIVAWDNLTGKAAAWSPHSGRTGPYSLGPLGVGALAVRPGGDTFAVVGSGVSVVDVPTGDLVSHGERPDAGAGYNSVAFAGDRLVAWPGDEFRLDVWDVSRSSAVAATQNCGCDHHRHAFDQTAERAAFATEAGALIFWDVVGNRTAARRTIVASTSETVHPLAVVRQRYVLYVVVRETGGGETTTGPLMAWDTETDATAKLWSCPDCEVREVLAHPDGGEIVIYTAASNGDGATYWLASLDINQR